MYTEVANANVYNSAYAHRQLAKIYDWGYGVRIDYAKRDYHLAEAEKLEKK